MPLSAFFRVLDSSGLPELVFGFIFMSLVFLISLELFLGASA